MSAINSPAIRVLIVDDHNLFRRGLIDLLTHDPQLCVVDDAANAVLALPMALALQPDVILLDNHMPRMSGIEALASLHTAAPKACIVLLTMSEDEMDLSAALRGGACGYLIKSMNCEDISAAVHRVVLGEIVISPEMQRKQTVTTQDRLACNFHRTDTP